MTSVYLDSAFCWNLEKLAARETPLKGWARAIPLPMEAVTRKRSGEIGT